MLDGEIVIVDAQGRSSFQKLQRAMGKATTGRFAYEVFDLIYLDGFDLTSAKLIDRKELLKQFVSSSTPANTESKVSFRSFLLDITNRRAIEIG